MKTPDTHLFEGLILTIENECENALRNTLFQVEKTLVFLKKTNELPQSVDMLLLQKLIHTSDWCEHQISLVRCYVLYHVYCLFYRTKNPCSATKGFLKHIWEKSQKARIQLGE